MGGARRLILIFAFLGFFQSEAFASNSDFYGSLIKAIDVVDVRAHISLDSGTWKSSLNAADLIWSIPATTVPELGFHYLHGTIVSDPDPAHDKLTYLQFPSVPGAGGKKVPTFMDVTVLKTVQGVRHCATFRIFRLEFDNGGTLNSNSQIELRPATPSCPGNGSFFDLNGFLKLAETSDAMFRGRIFAGLGPSASVVQCRDVECTPARTTKDNGPITEIQFFGFQNGISFSSGSPIVFSPTASITLDPGSKVGVSTLDYYLNTESGEAVFTDSVFAIRSGLLQVGSVILNLAEYGKQGPSTLRFPKIELKKDGNILKMTEGQLQAGLARGSVLTLMNDPQNPSQIVVDMANANFIGLAFTFGGGQQVISARQATIEVSALSATLGFSANNSAVLGYSSVDMVLGCQDLSKSATECPGFSWSPGVVTLVGEIGNVAGSLTGGRFAFGDAGYSRIHGGQFKGQSLSIDTRNKTPIVGKIAVKGLDLSGENIWIDASTNIKAASVSLDSDDLQFSADDKYPTGTVTLAGTVSEVTGGAFSALTLQSATLSATIGRQPGKKPEIISGEIKAVLALVDGATASATANLTIRQIHYYDGSGNAFLDFQLSSAKATYLTDEQTWKGSGTFDKVTIKLDAIELDFSLDGAIGKQNVPIQIANSKWNIEPFSLPFTLDLPLQDKELIYGIFETEPIGPNCTSHVKFVPHTYRITGNVTVGLSNLSYSVDGIDIDQGLQVDIDAGSCGKVVEAACFLAGTATFTPIGGVAAAVMCGKEIAKKEAELEQKVHDASLDKVRNLHFHSTH